LKLEKLMEGIYVKNKYKNADIKDVSSDNREITPGSVFVCINGDHVNAHNFAQKATADGAVAVVVDHDIGVENQLIVKDTREAHAKMCANFNGNPARKLKLVGVTGTNGKTTTATLIRQILMDYGHKTGFIGTTGYETGDSVKREGLTTPEGNEIHELFSKMVENGCTHCVMEVSSQALSQRRVFGLMFDVAVFTNITQDHLDYHSDMESYAKAKKELFKNTKVAIINLDSDYSCFMLQGLKCRKYTYAVDNQHADFIARRIIQKPSHVQYEIIGKNMSGKVFLNIPGRFSIYNSMAAAIGCLALEIPLKSISKSLSSAPGVVGRAEIVKCRAPYTIIIDYAHSPDSLENILMTLRESKTGDIITVFGCGGNRDKTKRPKMGEIAARLSDITIVTSDNPRNEDPNLIIGDILDGMQGYESSTKVVADRTLAIEYAMRIAREGDVILLAGKGHETYQIIGNSKIDYDEREIIAKILKKLNNEG
jgi:UDP-N-acetylmuramoyl-L-alanyl-D-glutamate--2,6-diaminopimelate ligase